MNVSRRTIFKFTLAGAALMSGPWPQLPEAAEELKMPGNVPEETFDFETKGVQGWSTVDGQWTVEEMAGAPSGKKVLVQRATPRLFYMHFWANDDPTKLAQALKAALDQTNSRK